jgi:hypothetical protein
VQVLAEELVFPLLNDQAGRCGSVSHWLGSI